MCGRHLPSLQSRYCKLQLCCCHLKQKKTIQAGGDILLSCLLCVDLHRCSSLMWRVWQQCAALLLPPLLSVRSFYDITEKKKIPTGEIHLSTRSRRKVWENYATWVAKLKSYDAETCQTKSHTGLMVRNLPFIRVMYCISTFGSPVICCMLLSCESVPPRHTWTHWRQKWDSPRSTWMQHIS